MLGRYRSDWLIFRNPMKGDLQTLCASSSSGQEFVVSSEKELGIINCLNNQISKSVTFFL